MTPDHVRPDRSASSRCSTGPGTENSFGGVAQAYADSVPVLIRPAGHARHLINVPPELQRLPELPQHHQVGRAGCTAAESPDVFRRAFTQVRNGRPRPGPGRESRGTSMTRRSRSRRRTCPRSARAVRPDPAGVREAARVLAAAERPVIYAGQGVHYAAGLAAAAALAELLEAPVTTSLQGKSAFAETHPLSLGSGGRSMPKPVRQFLDRSRRDLRASAARSRRPATASPMPAGKTRHPRDARPGRPEQERPDATRRCSATPA